MGYHVLRQSIPLLVLLLGPLNLFVSALPVIGSLDDTSINYNNSVIGPVRYHAEPVGRGTFGILLSCTATYIFCVWTCLHPNIIPDVTNGTRLWYKIVLMFLSILVPEGIMIGAFGELNQAREVKRRWREVMQKNEKSEKAQNLLGMDGAFFVVMGGFLINRCYVQDCSLKPGISGACQPGVRADDPIPQDTDKSPAKYNVQDYSLNIEHDLSGAGQLAAAGASPDGPTPQAIDKSPTRCNLQDCFLEPVVFRAGQLALPDSSILPQGTDKGPARCKAQDCSLELGVYRTILTPDGFIHCLEEGFIDETSFDKPAMVDKGKANRIAKLVAFLQAMWLVVQSFARWRDYRHLPLTLLEIHVLLQVACTTFTYICWWSKPLDVSEPITITLKRPGMSAGSTSQASKAPPPDSGPSPPPKMASPLSACTTLYEISETKDDNDAPNSPESEDHTPDPPEFKDHSEIQSLFNKSQNNIKLHYLTTKKPESHGLLVMLKALCDVMTPIISAAKGEDADTTTTNSKKGPKKYSGTRVMILEVALVLVVGGIHFIALKYDFATETERTLWILACSGIIVLPMIVIFIVIFTRYEGNLFQIIWQVPFNNMNGHSLLVYAFKSIHGICTEKAMKHRGEKRDFLYYVWVLCHYILVWICIILLITALSLSLLLTVESYMSLRLPPRGSFNTPRWTDWWPHI